MEARAEDLHGDGHEDEEESQPDRRTPAMPVADEIGGVGPVVMVFVVLFACAGTDLNLLLLVVGPGEA